MSNDNLDEYRAKLQKSKQQLKKVKQLLTQQPHNENLINLKKDLVEVITVTENLILKKQEKSYDPAKTIKTNKNNRNNNYDNKSQYPSNTNTNSTQSNDTNIYANNPMFIQNNVKTEKPKAQIPREWGVKKELYEIGERCQVKWQRKWQIAKILSRANNNNTNTNNTSDKKEDSIFYKVWFLNRAHEYTVSINNIRTYVPPLPNQLSIGMKIRAIWHKDGRFYPAIIEEISLDLSEYKIKYDKYNEYSSVYINDIQLILSNNNKNSYDSIYGIKRDNKNGNLTISDSVNIPSNLWSRDDDTPMEREKKRKKIKSIKKQHRNLKLDIESKNRANNWLKFKTKSLKKSKKKFQSTLLRKDKAKSIFESPSNVTNSIIDTNANMTHFKQRTHFHHLRKDPKHYKNNNNNNNNSNNNNQ